MGAGEQRRGQNKQFQEEGSVGTQREAGNGMGVGPTTTTKRARPGLARDEVSELSRGQGKDVKSSGNSAM